MRSYDQYQPVLASLKTATLAVASSFLPGLRTHVVLGLYSEGLRVSLEPIGFDALSSRQPVPIIAHLSRDGRGFFDFFPSSPLRLGIRSTIIGRPHPITPAPPRQGRRRKSRKKRGQIAHEYVTMVPGEFVMLSQFSRRRSSVLWVAALSVVPGVVFGLQSLDGWMDRSAEARLTRTYVHDPDLDPLPGDPILDVSRLGPDVNGRTPPAVAARWVVAFAGPCAECSVRQNRALASPALEDLGPMIVWVAATAAAARERRAQLPNGAFVYADPQGRETVRMNASWVPRVYVADGAGRLIAAQRSSDQTMADLAEAAR